MDINNPKLALFLNAGEAFLLMILTCSSLLFYYDNYDKVDECASGFVYVNLGSAQDAYRFFDEDRI